MSGLACARDGSIAVATTDECGVRATEATRIHNYFDVSAHFPDYTISLCGFVCRSILSELPIINWEFANQFPTCFRILSFIKSPNKHKSMQLGRTPNAQWPSHTRNQLYFIENLQKHFVARNIFELHYMPNWMQTQQWNTAVGTLGDIFASLILWFRKSFDDETRTQPTIECENNCLTEIHSCTITIPFWMLDQAHSVRMVTDVLLRNQTPHRVYISRHFM